MHAFLLIFIFSIRLSNASSSVACGSMHGNVVKMIAVDKSGHGDFTSVQQAIDSIPSGRAACMDRCRYQSRCLQVSVRAADSTSLDASEKWFFFDSLPLISVSCQGKRSQFRQTDSSFSSAGGGVWGAGWERGESEEHCDRMGWCRRAGSEHYLLGPSQELQG